MPAIETSQFGLLQYDESVIYRFPQGLPGFEQETAFLLVERPDFSPLTILQSVQTADLRFICAPVLLLDPDWEVPSELASEPVRPMAILTFPEHGAPTANLRAPIILNSQTREGFQAILTESLYSFEHPLRTAPAGAACS